MYRGLTVAVIAPCWNEEKKIANVVRRVLQTGHVDEMIVVDDGSTDASVAVAKSLGAQVLCLGATVGAGAAIRKGFDYVKGKYDVVVVIAGNDKDEPKEILRLLDPIADGKAVFVQGSRFLEGGGYGGAMPLYRKVATRVHPLLFSMVAGKRVTESTNGFRAFKTSLLEDQRIALHQEWLNGYELEPYLYLKVVRLGYPTLEVGVTKIYPSKELGYTKMRPLVDWWNVLRPLVLIPLGVKS